MSAAGQATGKPLPAAKERPILFSAPMVRALIEGRKTQTRRLVKPQPDWVHPSQHGSNVVAKIGPRVGIARQRCPYGQPGDLLWVRETFCLEHEAEGNQPPHRDGRPIKHNSDPFDGQSVWVQPHYRATDPAPELVYEFGTCPRCEDGEPHAHWKPSIHMPRWASRITLRITDVRVERLTNITAADALAEGVQIPVNADWRASWPRAHFASLWDGINAKRGHGWSANPWVWVVEFEVQA